MANNNNSSKRGFASMDEDKQREIASKGGKAAHEKGTAHEFDSAEGKLAGQKGGQARQAIKDEKDESPAEDLLDDIER
jgi:general stress protein YciG